MLHNSLTPIFELKLVSRLAAVTFVLTEAWRACG